MNIVMLTGRLTFEPKIYGTDEKKTAKYNLAVKCGADKVDFVPCVAFGKNADFAEKYLKKGTQIGVSGKIQHSEYTDKNGQKRGSTEVVVGSVEFLGKKNDAEVEVATVFVPIDSVSDDNLPFN